MFVPPRLYCNYKVRGKGVCGMTLDQLQYFLAISQCKSFTLAADHLYISQPALSKSIATLERELGVQLITRNTKTVSLTPAGEEFTKTCQLMLKTFQDGVNKMSSVNGTISGHVTVGLSNQYADSFVVDILRGVQKAYPLIRLEIHFFPPNGLLRAIDNHNIDIIFASDTPRNSQLKFRLLKRYRNCILLPDDHPLAGRSELSFEEVKNEGTIIIDSMLSGDEFDAMIEAARSEGCSPHVISITRSITELIVQVACGYGVAVLSDKYADHLHGNLVLIPLRQQSHSNLYLIWRDCSSPPINAIASFASSYSQEQLMGTPLE